MKNPNPVGLSIETTLYDRRQEVLEAAVKNNDIAALTEALEKGFDVNCRNSDGNTLLHIALEHKAGYECLKLLLENGASASIKNNKGLKPLQVIQQELSKAAAPCKAQLRRNAKKIQLGFTSTLLSLFKLEKYINIHDCDGTTLMHLLMVNRVDEETFEKIMSISSGFQGYFTAQNSKGQTPLHIAAETLAGDALDFVLSNINESSLLKRDYKGNTFLHTCLGNTYNYNYVTNNMSDKWEVLIKILDGKYKCCVGECLKQLVESRNDIQETPFHVFIDKAGFMNVEICEKFLKAGADFNCSNIKGETVLHKLPCWDGSGDTLSWISFIVRNGADLNKKNIFLETPLFHTTNSFSITKLFLDNGSAVNAQNKVGKNVLMAHLLKDDVDPELIDLLLKRGVDVNAEDIHGNTCLHYAAWKNVRKEVVQQLKNSGANMKTNKIGELPCIVAEKMQHYDLLDELCICLPGIHSCKTLKMGAIKIEDLHKAFEVREGTGGFEVNDLLKVPNFGSVEFIAEAEELKQAVTNVVKDICQAIGEKDKLLKNTVFQSGSVWEKTKVGLPDEFDFTCLVDFISNVCEIDQERSEDDPGFAYIKLKKEHLGKKCREMFDADCFLENYLLYLRFLSALRVAMNTPDFYTHANLVFCRDLTKQNPTVPNCNFSLRWTGAVYKDIVVDVDLVPACRILHWWPSGTNLESIVGDRDKLKRDGAFLLLQTTVDEDFKPQAKLRVSAQPAEKVHMEALPQLARDSYMVTKIISSDNFCPEVKLGNHCMRKRITSYMMKNCMFHVFKEVLGKADAETLEQPSETLNDIVVRIFKILISFAESGKLPAFIFPWQNVFTFRQGPTDAEVVLARINKVDFMRMKIYAKLILKFLDEFVDFTDCDVKVATQAFQVQGP